MKVLSFSTRGIAILPLFITFLFLLSDKLVQADDCCFPPPLPPEAARFLPDSKVTVYVDTASGFTPTEVDAIKAGLEDWNDEPNNSGVTYKVVPTNNPPPPGADKTIVAKFINEPGSTEAQLNLSRSTVNGVPKISGELTFWNRIRSGTPSLLSAFLRSTARHEGGHGVGLENSDVIGCPEGSNIMYPSRNVETFITPCDNAAINEDPVYGGGASPTPTPASPCFLLCPVIDGTRYKPNPECTDCIEDPDNTPVLLDVLGNGFAELVSRVVEIYLAHPRWSSLHFRRR